jgi:hypothetical protein
MRHEPRRTVSCLPDDPAQEVTWLRAENAHRNQELVRLSAALQCARESRAVIEQAKGVLAGLGLTSADKAFPLLVMLSQYENVKLRHIAEVIVRLARTLTDPDIDRLLDKLLGKLHGEQDADASQPRPGQDVGLQTLPRSSSRRPAGWWRPPTCSARPKPPHKDPERGNTSRASGLQTR